MAAIIFCNPVTSNSIWGVTQRIFVFCNMENKQGNICFIFCEHVESAITKGVKDFVAGGAGGIAQIVSSYPFDTAKVINEYLKLFI